jgi:16S rRNA C967 or C1407 C5-methylase (RsmB/RsmF family)/NOL1/NOP2/fmu family ribosome biogenesis protein
LTFIKYTDLSLQLPPAFLASLQTVKGFDEGAFEEVHTSGRQVISIRFNPAKDFTTSHQYPKLDKVPWSSQGYYLSERPSFTTDPLFHAGTYYVQDASSMFLEEAIRQSCELSQQLRVLDLCAAPGGKSTLIQSIISSNSLLVSNEIIKSRVNVLSENISKWGAANTIVTSNNPKDFRHLPSYFDLIVVDAPCSGSGLFRKDPEAIHQWSLDVVEICSQRQERILADIFSSLKPGGILIYSTCSYSENENERVADWIFSNNSFTCINLEFKNEWRIIETHSPVHHAPCYRFYPDKVRGEGFFLAVFKKSQGEKETKVGRASLRDPKEKLILISQAESAVIRPYIADINLFTFWKWQDEILALPRQMAEELILLQSVLYLRKAGVKVGSIIRNELIPDHELALSNLVSEAVPSVEVDKENALQYLRRNELRIQTNLRGWALIRYQSANLGWIKILPGRINNYYPKNWRIMHK